MATELLPDLILKTLDYNGDVAKRKTLIQEFFHKRHRIFSLQDL